MTEILFEDNDIIVVKKPFGLAAQPGKRDEKSLCGEISDYLFQKDKNTKLGIIHRLDQPVSGIMVFGKNKKASAALTDILTNGGFLKEYLAVCCGNAQGGKRLTDWIFKNQRQNISKIVNKNSPSAKEAVLEYNVLKTIELNGESLSLLNIRLFTGRHHQIRVQLANDGLPIWGDTKYNPALKHKRALRNIGLCAYKLEFPHPKTKNRLSFSIEEKEEPFSFFID